MIRFRRWTTKMPSANRQPYFPGGKEVWKKVREAIKALEDGYYEIVDDSQNARTFESLQVYTMEEVLEWIIEFLEEIYAANAQDCFCGIGGRVEFCNKAGFSDVRLYAYHWDSEKMGKRMYLKFGLKQRGSKTVFTYLHLSCHDDETPTR